MMLFGLTWMDRHGLRDALKELSENTNKIRGKISIVLATVAERRDGTTFHESGDKLLRSIRYS